MKRRELTNREKACATRLKALWLEKKHREGLSQEKAGEALGMSAGALNQYLNGKIPLNTDVTFRFAQYFGVPPQEINPEWLGADAGKAGQLARIGNGLAQLPQEQIDKIEKDILFFLEINRRKS